MARLRAAGLPTRSHLEGPKQHSHFQHSNPDLFTSYTAEAPKAAQPKPPGKLSPWQPR